MAQQITHGSTHMFLNTLSKAKRDGTAYIYAFQRYPLKGLKVLRSKKASVRTLRYSILRKNFVYVANFAIRAVLSCHLLLKTGLWLAYSYQALLLSQERENDHSEIDTFA